MKHLVVILVVLLASVAWGIEGDILRSMTLSGQPANGVRGLAKDWDTGDIWVAGPQGTSSIIFTEMDEVTMSTGTWMTASGQYWVFDIGYGYDDMGTKYLIMNDQQSPFSRMYDPSNGSFYGSLPDYYSAGNYTDGCSVDWATNYVYLSSYGDANCVYYDGSSWNVFTNIPGALNMGCAVGWGHVFYIRTSTYYTIEVYQLDGTFVESISLNSWPSGNYIMGLACGQENEVGDHETLFFADFVSRQVHEVEVGNYETSLERSTWGEIKAVFGETPDGHSPYRSIH
jgi:hypothetical protein